MSTSERERLEALATEWETRAVTREQSVAQVYQECARMLRAAIPKGLRGRPGVK